MIDGQIFKDAVISGAYHIANQKNRVDELNAVSYTHLNFRR